MHDKELHAQNLGSRSALKVADVELFMHVDGLQVYAEDPVAWHEDPRSTEGKSTGRSAHSPARKPGATTRRLV
jgi:hypothetical protein